MWQAPASYTLFYDVLLLVAKSRSYFAEECCFAFISQVHTFMVGFVAPFSSVNTTGEVFMYHECAAWLFEQLCRNGTVGILITKMFYSPRMQTLPALVSKVAPQHRSCNFGGLLFCEVWCCLSPHSFFRLVAWHRCRHHQPLLVRCCLSHGMLCAPNQTH